MFSHKTRTPARRLAACDPLPVTIGDCAMCDCAMCDAAGVDVIPLGTYPGAPSQCADRAACADRMDAISARWNR